MHATDSDSPSAGDGGQADVLAFLKRPVAWPSNPERVDVMETHGAFVFLAGSEVLKVKREVQLAYLDFSTLDYRRRFCERELEINRPHAPELYLGVVPITREADGALAIAGAGKPVEWAVKMRRFGQDQHLSHIAGATGIDRPLAVALGDMAADYHANIAALRGVNDPMPQTCSALVSGLEALSNSSLAAAARGFGEHIRRNLTSSAPVREARAAAGCIRRCHGDLHLGNIVLWKGRDRPAAGRGSSRMKYP